MAKTNLNTQAKRKRELAKKDKRAAKDEKRAIRKAEARTARSAEGGTAPPAQAAQPAAKSNLSSLAAAAFIRRMNKTP
jgi:hypothetical protein